MYPGTIALICNNMWKAAIKKESETPTAWIFGIRVTTEDKKTFSYTITVDKDHYRTLTDEVIPPVTLIERTFFFLAEREPFSAILKEFNLHDVERYFPEYEKHMKASIV